MSLHQCKSCPWKIDCNPDLDIPGDYSIVAHKSVSRTIADPASLAGLGEPLAMMACHQTAPGKEHVCAGWLAHQLGPGNNIVLRLRVMTDPELQNYELDGPQHVSFEDTLPARLDAEVED